MEQFVQMSALYSHMHFWAWSSHVFEGLLREPLLTQEVRLASAGIRAQSRQVHGEPLQIGERAIGQSSLVSDTQDDAGRLVRFERLLPAGCT